MTKSRRGTPARLDVEGSLPSTPVRAAHDPGVAADAGLNEAVRRPWLTGAIEVARAIPGRQWLLAGIVVAFLAIGLVRPAPSRLDRALDPAAAAASAPAAANATATPFLSGGPAPSGLATLGSEAVGRIDVLDLLLKGTLVIALLFITLRVLRRVQSGTNGATSRINVLESRPLAAKASLHLVAVGDRRLLVGLTPAGLVSLTELEAAQLGAPEGDPAHAPDAAAAQPSFASLLPPRVQDSLRNFRRGADR